MADNPLARAQLLAMIRKHPDPAFGYVFVDNKAQEVGIRNAQDLVEEGYLEPGELVFVEQGSQLRWHFTEKAIKEATDG